MTFGPVLCPTNQGRYSLFDAGGRVRARAEVAADGRTSVSTWDGDGDRQATFHPGPWSDPATAPRIAGASLDGPIAQLVRAADS